MSQNPPDTWSEKCRALVEGIISAFYTGGKILRIGDMTPMEGDRMMLCRLADYPLHPGICITFGGGTSQEDARVKIEVLAVLPVGDIAGPPEIVVPTAPVCPKCADPVEVPTECAKCNTTYCRDCLRPAYSDFAGDHAPFMCAECSLAERYFDIPNDQR